MADMRRDMADFHRANQVQLCQTNAHLGRLVSAIVEHLGGPGAPPPRPSGSSPQGQGSPPATPSPPWPTSPEYRALFQSVLGGPRPAPDVEGPVPRRPSIIVPSVALCSAAGGDGGSTPTVPVSDARHGGVGVQPSRCGSMVARTGSTSAARAGCPPSGGEPLTGSNAGSYTARSGGRTMGGMTVTVSDPSLHAAGRAGISSGSETLSASEGGLWEALPVAVGRPGPVAGGPVRHGRLAVLSSGSETVTLSDASQHAAGRACYSSGSETLTVSGDSQRLPSSDEF